MIVPDTPYSVVTAIRAPHGSASLHSGGSEYATNLNIKRMLSNEKAKLRMQKYRSRLKNKERDNNEKYLFLKQQTESRNTARAKGLAGVYDDRNFEEVLPSKQAFMLLNVPFSVMQALLECLHNPQFKSYFEDHAYDINLTLEAGMSNISLPSQKVTGKYLFFYWHDFRETLPKYGKFDTKVSRSSIRENNRNEPGRCYANSPHVDRCLKIALQTIDRLITNGLRRKLQWPLAPSTNTEFAVVGSGRLPVHQELHCDNEASYKLALATTTALIRPLIAIRRERDAHLLFHSMAAKFGWILHVPATIEGMSLRVAEYTDVTLRTVKIRNVYIPFGSCFLARADVFHSGCYGSPHNLRVHAIYPADDLEWNENSLLFLQQKRNFELPNVEDDCTSTAPDEMLQDKFSLLSLPSHPGYRSKQQSRYMHDFQTTLEGSDCASIYEDQHQLLIASKSAMKSKSITVHTEKRLKRTKAEIGNTILKAKKEALAVHAQKALKKALTMGKKGKQRWQRHALREDPLNVPYVYDDNTKEPFDVQQFFNGWKLKKVGNETFTEFLISHRYDIAVQEVFFYLECDCPPPLMHAIDWANEPCISLSDDDSHFEL